MENLYGHRTPAPHQTLEMYIDTAVCETAYDILLAYSDKATLSMILGIGGNPSMKEMERQSKEMTVIKNKILEKAQSSDPLKWNINWPTHMIFKIREAFKTREDAIENAAGHVRNVLPKIYVECKRLQNT